MFNEFGRLMKGVGKRMPTGSNTMEFVSKSHIPTTKPITYARIVCDYMPLKSEPNRTRLTVGGDTLTCDHETSTDTADLILIKLFFNSILSNKHVQFLFAGIKDFFLANNIHLSPKFMRIHVSFVPQEIIDQYNLKPLIHNDWLYIKITKEMYGLNKLGIWPTKTSKLTLPNMATFHVGIPEVSGNMNLATFNSFWLWMTLV